MEPSREDLQKGREELENVISNEENSLIVGENSVLASVIIEEIDQSTANSMDVDMSEFVEAKALKIHHVTDNTSLEVHQESGEMKQVLDSIPNVEEMDILIANEEDRLTTQFLNGELTFSEYTFRMDHGSQSEMVEAEPSSEVVPEDSTANESQENHHEEEVSAGTKRKQRRRNLPPALEGLMGEANLRYARGEISLAADICMEIIRQVPSAPEPFQTLAMIYETDQPEKSLQFSLIAAHLSPKDADQWVRLASMSLESGDIKQAITCYSKAIQADPKDVELYELRARLQEQSGDKKAFVRGYTRLIGQLGPEDGEKIIHFAKMLAKRYMQDGSNQQALEAIEQVFSKCPDLVTLEEVNVMTELLISLKHFHRCLDILTQYTTIWVKYKGEDTDGTTNRKIEACEMPDDVVVDLKAKLLITLIELDEIEISDELLPRFYNKENPEISGDLYLDVAEALMGKKYFQKALILLEPLVNSQNYSLAAVWLRHAECWVECKDIEKAIRSYEIVRNLSSQHLGAKFELAKLYKLKGQYSEAIEVLNQDADVDVLDPGLIYERTLLFLELKKYDEFFQSGMLLLSRHCIILRSRAELGALTKGLAVRQRVDSLQLQRLSRGEKLIDDNAPAFSKMNEPSLEDEFLLFLKMCNTACELRRFGLLQRITFTTLTSKKFEEKNSHILFLCLVACIHNNDSYYGFNIVREMVRVCHKSNYWNLLNIIIQRSEDARHNRFIMRLLVREDAFSYLQILHANNCLVSGTYKYALNDYVSLFKVAPSSLLALLIAITQLQMACQKFFAKKNQLVVQALAFMKKYMQMRGEHGQQEYNYNMARVFHQLGLLPGAVHHYKLVLNSPETDLVREFSNLLDLKREAAFNLHLIYLQSDNRPLARIFTMLASEITFQELCNVFERVVKAKSAPSRANELRKFFDKLRNLREKLKKGDNDTDMSLYPVIRLILPNLERERGPHNLKEKSCANLLIRVFGLHPERGDAQKLLQYKAPLTKQFVGNDFAERVHLVLKNRLSCSTGSVTIEEVNHFLDAIAEKPDKKAKIDKVKEFQKFVHRINPVQMKWLIRIILRDVKLGLGRKRTLQAYHQDAEELYDVSSDLRNICDTLVDPNSQLKHDIKFFSHFKPMLLEKCKIEDVGKLFSKDQVPYYLQTKYDGERSQLHMKNGVFKYFTRQGFDITNNPGYGETPVSGGFLTSKIAQLLNCNCTSIILDGELMGWHKESKVFGSQGMNYDVKKLTNRSSYQPCFVAFDIIAYNDEIITNLPYKERLKVLNNAFSEQEGILLRSDNMIIADRNQLIEAFNKSLDDKEEGIVLKRHDMKYKPNVREKSGCYKIKADYSDNLVADIDLIIVGAYYGDGRATGLFKSFLLAVANASGIIDGNPTKFEAVVSVSNGFSYEKLKEIKEKYKNFWTTTRPENVTGPRIQPPDFWIEPEHSLVVQLRATEMIRTKDYPTGYTLRFPRVVHIRDDKPWTDVCTTKEFLAFAKDGTVVQKLTKRYATVDDIDEVPQKKSPRVSKSQGILIHGFIEKDATAVIHITRLFEGKEFCVINGNEETTKAEIVRILLQHKGQVVEHPRKDTFCVIVGNPKTAKARNVIESGKYNVTNVEWLKKVTKEENWSKLRDWEPCDLLAVSPMTKLYFSEFYDEFDDGFEVDADEKSLRWSFEKAADKSQDTELSSKDFQALNKELFNGEKSPFSPYQGIRGYFDDPSDYTQYIFRFMGGTVKPEIDDSVDYVFINENSKFDGKINTSPIKPLKFVRTKWIEDSFKERKLLPELAYSI